MVQQESPLTAKEHAQWMLHRLVPRSGICNLIMTMRVEQRLRWWPLQEALNQLLYRHQGLRAVSRSDGGVPRKLYRPLGESFPLATTSATEDTLPALLAAFAAEPFELEGELLVRGLLVLLPASSVVCVVIHHLVADYTSLAVLEHEIAQLYDGFAGAGEPPASLAGPVPLHHQREPSAAAVRYWLDHLAGVDPTQMALAGARAITGRPTFSGAQLRHRMSEDAFAALHRLKERTGATENIVLLAAFYLLLVRNGAGPDLVVGVPVSGRLDVPSATVGFHAVTLPIRVKVEDDLDAEALVHRVRDAFMGGLMHAEASFESVQRSLAARSGEWRAPLFRHMFNFRPSGTTPSATIGGQVVGAVEVDHGVSRHDVEFLVRPQRDGMRITLRYSTEVHVPDFAAALAERYDSVLTGLADALGRPVGRVTGRCPADERATSRRNATRRRLPSSVLAGVQRSARADPLASALRVRGQITTYGELVARAEKIRRALSRRGAGPDDVVALHAARGPALAAAVLGVWATGAAYLPLDRTHPDSRICGQIEDCDARWVLTDGKPDLERFAGRECLPIGRHGPCPDPAAMPDWRDPEAGQLAYVIYTSGSTGRPKGVEISHGSLANLVWDFAGRLGAGAADRTLWQTTFSFDISALEMLMPLLTGGSIVVAQDEDRTDPARLLALIAEEDVGIVQATPTGWRHVTGQLNGQLRGRRVLCGGEPLDASLAGRLLADGCRLFNVYGPTETTIWSAVAELRAPVRDPVPLGEPIANTALHVLTAQGRLVPPGVAGELCIGGAGVAAGYRGRPELTKQRFIDDPEVGRYYRTGDMVRENDGEVIFLGRLDRQVKVRGHRIELTEVESVLCSHPEVRAAVAVTEPDGSGGLRLVVVVQPVDAPVATEKDGAGSASCAGREATGRYAPGLESRLHTYAAQQLPAGAVPSRYVVVEELPATGNGKVDMATLAARIRDGVGAAPLPPDPTLRRLISIWREVLRDDRLGADAHFFLCGGHSLLAGQLAGRLAREFRIPVGFDAIFDAPTPTAFHSRINDARHAMVSDGGEP
jgi:amino acid adenylation domain-containing protein